MATLSLAEISHVIVLATAPAFLLGGIVALVALLTAQLGRLLERTGALLAIPEAHRHGRWREAVAHLRRRARLLHAAMALALLSGIVTACLVVLAFVGALLGLALETPVATLFILSFVLFAGALAVLAAEVMAALDELGLLEVGRPD
jgi:hypothetical protein